VPLELDRKSSDPVEPAAMKVRVPSNARVERDLQRPLCRAARLGFGPNAALGAPPKPACYRLFMHASAWRREGGRWIRTQGPYVVAQATERGWYVMRLHGTGGMSGSAATVEAARVRIDRILLRDGWELEF
jgi:hypothetical protein